MPRNSQRKYRQVIDYIEDEVGVDIPRDIKKMAIEQVDDPLASDGLPVDVAKIAGTDQSAADLLAVLQSVADDDEVRIALETDNLSGNLDVDIAEQALAQIVGDLELEDQAATGTYGNIHRRGDALQISLEADQTGVLKTSDQPLDVSDTEVDVDIATQSLSPLTITDDGNLAIAAWNAGTLTVTDDGSLNVAGVVSIQEDTPLDVSSSPITVGDITSWNAGAIGVNIQDDDPSAETTTLASGADISGGVTASINKRDFTIYIENTGANSSDVTVSYSPDGGTTFFPSPDGAITLAAGSSTIIEVGYDATDIEVSASNTETFNVNLVER